MSIFTAMQKCCFDKDVCLTACQMNYFCDMEISMLTLNFIYFKILCELPLKFYVIRKIFWSLSELKNISVWNGEDVAPHSPG